MGGIARVGISSVSFANMAVSDRSPLERLMSDTCGARALGATRKSGHAGARCSSRARSAHRYVVFDGQPGKRVQLRHLAPPARTARLTGVLQSAPGGVCPARRSPRFAHKQRGAAVRR